MAARTNSSSRTHLRFPEEEAFLALQRSADRLQRASARFFETFGLTPTQFNVLRILRGAGPAGLACNAIASRMIRHDPDITRLLSRLEKQGWAVRARDAGDRRVVVAHITPAGLRLLNSMDRPLRLFLRELLGHMGGTRLRLLIRLMQDAQAALPEE